MLLKERMSFMTSTDMRSQKNRNGSKKEFYYAYVCAFCEWNDIVLCEHKFLWVELYGHGNAEFCNCMLFAVFCNQCFPTKYGLLEKKHAGCTCFPSRLWNRGIGNTVLWHRRFSLHVGSHGD